MTTVKASPEERWLWAYPFSLPVGATSGSFVVRLPQLADYIAVLNGTGATLNYAPGQLYAQPSDAVAVEPYIYIGLPIQTTDTVTVFWSSSSPIAPSNSQGVLLFSNLTIPVSGGPMTTGGVSQNVQVTNTVTAQISGTPNVNISTMPPLPPGGNTVGGVTLPQVTAALGAALPADALLVGGSDGTDLRAIATDATGAVKIAAGNNTIGNVTLSQVTAAPGAVLPTGALLVGGSDGADLRAIATDSTGAVKLAAGGNTIGSVILAGTANLIQAAVQGIVSTNQVTINTTATALFSGTVSGRSIAIQNLDTVNKLYIGTSSVTTSNGFPIPPGGTYSMDVVPGSTITIYGVAATSIQVATLVVG
ncbi:MAG: hypothetical protein K6T26_07495 [Alicyclobacillus sp.]|nr:hypothetical protein [Alicyclobacillus sp.]